jgi:molecular chaperone HscC
MAIIGIDLGTTNSLVSLWRDGESVLIPNALGQNLTPSVVSLTDKGDVLVGQAAKDRQVTHPDRTAAVFKRYMGTDKRIKLGKQAFRPEELSALVLKALKADAEAFLNETVTEAVITVPAYFNDTQRKATRRAGELAGLKVERLLNEPTAAALAYGLHQQDGQFLIFDLGGGTFDVSILELFEGVMEVRATAGDNYLGGEDFVTALVDGFVASAGAATKPNATDLTKLRVEAERVKRRLSTESHTEFTADIAGKSHTWQVSQAAFEEAAAPLLERVRKPIERAMRDAKLKPQDLDHLVLVGGATRMPILHKLVARLFGRFPRRDIHPDEAIALGAAVQAGLKARDAALKDVVLTDVAPYTLGMEVADELGQGRFRHGLYLPIIDRNTVIPTSKSKQVFPLLPGQTELSVRIFQGEAREVKDNILLGELAVTLPKDSSQHGVEVRYTYDINGLLEVEATPHQGKPYRLLIKQSDGLSDAEAEARLKLLAGLKIAPRQQAENQALLSRLARLYEEHLGDERQWLGQQTTIFESVLDRQDPKEINAAREALQEALNRFDKDLL